MHATSQPMRIQLVQSPPPVTAAWICLILAWFFLLLPIPIVSWGLGWVFGMIAFILEIIVIARGAMGLGLLQIIIQMLITPIVYFAGLQLFADLLK